MLNALTLCNGCEAADRHTGCDAGYCGECCTAHPQIGWEFTHDTTGAVCTLKPGVNPADVDEDTRYAIGASHGEFRPVYDVRTYTTAEEDGLADDDRDEF